MFHKVESPHMRKLAILAVLFPLVAHAQQVNVQADDYVNAADNMARLMTGEKIKSDAIVLAEQRESANMRAEIAGLHTEIARLSWHVVTPSGDYWR